MKNKQINIEILRIIACFGVVMVHVVRQGILYFGGGLEENPGDVWTNLSRFAVPCFLMITGWIWLDEKRTYDPYKCIQRVVIPLFSFGYVFSLMELVYDERRLAPGMFIKAFLNILTGALWGHMWYLYMLIGIYILLPAIRILASHWSEHDWHIVLAVLFVFQIIFPTIKELTGSKVGFYLPINGPYILYLLLGHYLQKKQMRLSYAVLNMSCAILVILIYSLVLRLDTSFEHILTFWEGCAVYQVAVAAGPYCEKYKGNVIRYLGRKTFGIYILHPVFTNFLYRVIRLDPYFLPTGLNWLILTVPVFILSLAATVIIQKIPLLNKVFCV